MNIDQLHSEIVKQLNSKTDSRLIEKAMYYHKKVGEMFGTYGISAIQFKQMFKRYRTIFKELSFQERIKLSLKFFQSGCAEQTSFGIELLKLNLRDMKPADLGFIETTGEYLNNWGGVDGYCVGVLHPLLLKYPEETLQLLRKWNGSESLWKRRASVVAFTRRVGKSGKFTKEALEMCDNLIWDKEDYVKKGVGWALKDVMRGDKKTVLKYVEGLRQKGVSSVITLYAIRDLKGTERKKILNLRSQNSLG